MDFLKPRRMDFDSSLIISINTKKNSNSKLCLNVDDLATSDLFISKWLNYLETLWWSYPKNSWDSKYEGYHSKM